MAARHAGPAWGGLEAPPPAPVLTLAVELLPVDVVRSPRRPRGSSGNCAVLTLDDSLGVLGVGVDGVGVEGVCVGVSAAAGSSAAG